MRTRWNRVRVGWRVDGPGGRGGRDRLGDREVACWGHTTPFFAPVAAIIALGQSYHQRGRRAVELVVGVSLGIAVADVLASELGTGAAQLALAVFLAIGLGLFFGHEPAVRQPGRGLGRARLHAPAADRRDLVRALAGRADRRADRAARRRGPAPGDPLRLLRERGRGRCWRSSRRCSTTSRRALRARDPEAAEAALERARGDRRARRAASSTRSRESRETTRFSPARRRARDAVEFYAEAAARIDLAVRNVRVLARGAMRALALDENVPPDVADALDDLAAAVRALGGALERGDGLRRACASRRCAPPRSPPACSRAPTNLSVA